MTASPNPDSPMPGLTDEQIVRRIQQGHAHLYAELVRRYTDRIYGTCHRICGNADDAADLTQDALVRGFEKIGSFDGRSAFGTWMYRLAVNMALSWLRRCRLRRTQDIDGMRDRIVDRSVAEHPVASRNGSISPRSDHPARPASLTTPASESSRSDEYDDLGARAIAALAGLDDDHRSVIVLRDIEGLEYALIAEILQINIGTVKSRLHRGRLQLREAVLPHDRRGACT